MRKAVIADTSCLILLYKVGELTLLRGVYDEVAVTQEVADEFQKPLPDWIRIHQVKNKEFQQALQLQIDKGEASSIALAMELKDATLILDDLSARKVAEKLHLNYTGTFGVIAKARKKGVIASVIPIIEKIRKTNFYISEQVINETLKEAGEI